jgi:formamidopyrimidine-DNA glycosylase
VHLPHQRAWRPVTQVRALWPVACLCRKCKADLGPDPLREDADAELLWAMVQASKKPIGLVLMDQTMVAGLGNIYRAEVLFKVC